MTSCLPISTFSTTLTNMPGESFRPGLEKTRRARRPRGHVHLGVNEVHAAFECAARISIHSERRSVADLDACEVVLKDLSKNPNGRKIGHRVQAGFWLDREIGQGIAFGDVARDCRIDLELLLHLPG